MRAYGHFVYRFRVWLVVAGLVCMIIGGFYAGGVYQSLGEGGFNVPNSQSSMADDIVNRQFGGGRESLVVLLSSDKLLATDPAFARAAAAKLQLLARQPGVSSINSYYNSGNRRLISKNGHETYALAGLSGTSDQQADTVHRLMPLVDQPVTGNAPLRLRLGGQAAVNAESTGFIKHDLAAAERVAFPLSALLLLIFFRSLLAAVLPLALGLYGIIGALVITRLVALAMPMSAYVLNLVNLLGLGLAIDYSLFIVSRFREELHRHGGDVELALGRTVATAGRTVIFSAMTVMVSLAGLVLFPINFLRSMGVGGSAAVLIALLGSLLFLPALLGLVGTKIDALNINRIVPHHVRRRIGDQGNLRRIAELVMARPVLVLLAALGLLLAAGLPFLRVTFIDPDYHVLPLASQARQVGNALDHDFAMASQTPINAVVELPGPQTGAASASAALTHYSQELTRLPGVSAVMPESISRAGSAANYALVRVIPKTGTYDAASQKLVRDVRRTPSSGLPVLVGGRTAGLVDMLDSVRHYSIYALIVVLSAMLILFFLLLGSLVVPIKTVILNVLSLSASFGVLVWIFQQGHFVRWIGATAMPGIDATQPVIIFALAFGLSMDYAIFLFSRIKEHFDEQADMRRAIAWGVQKTGGIITSAALLLVVVIAGFAAGRIIVMKEVAIGLIVAVLVDVFIVRLLLVPASMTLLGRYNWWAPAPLKRLHEKLHLSESDPPFSDMPGAGEEPPSRGVVLLLLVLLLLAASGRNSGLPRLRRLFAKQSGPDYWVK